MHPVADVCIESGVTGLQVNLLGVLGGLSRKILIAINSHHSEPGLAD